MKPTSIIFLIVSVLLACVGVLLCFTASNMAANHGTAIFSQTGSAETGYNYTTEYRIDSEKISQISFDLADTDVYVYRTDDDSRIELVNFPEGTYNFTENKTNIKLTDTTSVKNWVDIDNFKINFNGFRDYLHYFRYRDNRRAVNLYLNGSIALNRLSIISNGNITVDGNAENQNTQLILSDTDCEFITRGGDFSISYFSSNSLLRLEATEEAIIELNAVNVNTLEIYGVYANTTIRALNFTYALYIDLNQGRVDYNLGGRNFDNFNLLLEVKNGVIKYGSQTVRDGLYVENNYDEAVSPSEPGEPEEPDEQDEPDETEQTDPAEQTEEETTEQREANRKVTPNAAIIVVKNGDIVIQ